jgi:hypothetical protein
MKSSKNQSTSAGLRPSRAKKAVFATFFGLNGMLQNVISWATLAAHWRRIDYYLAREQHRMEDGRLQREKMASRKNCKKVSVK